MPGSSIDRARQSSQLKSEQFILHQSASLPVSKRKKKNQQNMPTAALKLLIALIFIASLQGSNGQRCDPSSSIQVQTINTGAAAGGDTVFEVVVRNLCVCAIRSVRLDGGGFATTVGVDPAVFRADDGGVYLVNGGGRIPSTGTVSFRYTWDHFFQMTPRSLEEDEQC